MKREHSSNHLLKYLKRSISTIDLPDLPDLALEAVEGVDRGRSVEDDDVVEHELGERLSIDIPGIVATCSD